MDRTFVSFHLDNSYSFALDNANKTIGDSTEAQGSRGKKSTKEKIKERLAHPLHGKESE